LDSRIRELVDTIRRLEVELEVELAKRRTELAFTVRGRVVQFEEKILRRHRQLKTGVARYLLGSRPLLLLTAPVDSMRPRLGQLLRYAVLIPLRVSAQYVAHQRYWVGHTYAAVAECTLRTTKNRGRRGPMQVHVVAVGQHQFHEAERVLRPGFLAQSQSTAGERGNGPVRL
jgi:hypothetical protein